MDDTTYLLRPYTDADFEVDSRVWSGLEPEQPISAEELRHHYRRLDAPEYFKHFLVADERSTGQGVAVGALFNAPWAFDPDWYWISVGVDRAHQNRGIGRELYRVLAEQAISRRAKGMWCAVRADHLRAVRFFERCGFVEQRRAWVSRLELTGANLSTATVNHEHWAKERVIFTTLAAEGPERPEVQRRLYALDTQASKDAPRMGPVTTMPFEQFVEFTFRSPGFLPEGGFVARVGDEYVSMTMLERLPAQPDTLQITFTGTRRDFRGRGLASELKRLSAEFARDRGYRYLQTGNDSVNPAIWAINKKLGFRIERTFIFGEKEMVPTEPIPPRSP